MELLKVIMVVLTIGMILLTIKVYKNTNIEKFEQDQVDLIQTEINKQYNMDIEAIRNLGAISKSLLTGSNYHSTETNNPGTLTIPADTVIEGDLNVDGKINFTNRDTLLMNILPSGMVIAWAKSEIPLGWAVCDGENETPDLRGRFVLAAGEGKTYQYDTGKVDAEGNPIIEERVLTTRALDDNNGEEQHTLTVDEMPSHNHAYTMVVGRYMYGDGDYAWRLEGTKSNRTAHSGGSQPHDNMPPYYVLIYIMKL